MSFSEFSLQGFSKVRWMGYFAYILWSDTLEWNEASMHRCNALLSTIGNQELVYGVRSSRYTTLRSTSERIKVHYSIWEAIA